MRFQPKFSGVKGIYQINKYTIISNYVINDIWTCFSTIQRPIIDVFTQSYVQRARVCVFKFIILYSYTLFGTFAFYVYLVIPYAILWTISLSYCSILLRHRRTIHFRDWLWRLEVGPWPRSATSPAREVWSLLSLHYYDNWTEIFFMPYFSMQALLLTPGSKL